MSLHAGIDTVAWVSMGLFTKTYGASEQANINSLYVSLGLLEKAPEPAEVVKGGFLKKIVATILSRKKRRR